MEYECNWFTVRIVENGNLIYGKIALTEEGELYLITCARLQKYNIKCRVPPVFAEIVKQKSGKRRLQVKLKESEVPEFNSLCKPTCFNNGIALRNREFTHYFDSTGRQIPYSLYYNAYKDKQEPQREQILAEFSERLLDANVEDVENYKIASFYWEKFGPRIVGKQPGCEEFRYDPSRMELAKLQYEETLKLYTHGSISAKEVKYIKKVNAGYYPSNSCINRKQIHINSLNFTREAALKYKYICLPIRIGLNGESMIELFKNHSTISPHRLDNGLRVNAHSRMATAYLIFQQGIFHLGASAEMLALWSRELLQHEFEMDIPANLTEYERAFLSEILAYKKGKVYTSQFFISKKIEMPVLKQPTRREYTDITQLKGGCPEIIINNLLNKYDSKRGTFITYNEYIILWDEGIHDSRLNDILPSELKAVYDSKREFHARALLGIKDDYVEETEEQIAKQKQWKADKILCEKLYELPMKKIAQEDKDKYAEALIRRYGDGRYLMDSITERRLTWAKRKLHPKDKKKKKVEQEPEEDEFYTPFNETSIPTQYVKTKYMHIPTSFEVSLPRACINWQIPVGHGITTWEELEAYLEKRTETVPPQKFFNVFNAIAFIMHEVHNIEGIKYPDWNDYRDYIEASLKESEDLIGGYESFIRYYFHAEELDQAIDMLHLRLFKSPPILDIHGRVLKEAIKAKVPTENWLAPHDLTCLYTDMNMPVNPEEYSDYIAEVEQEYEEWLLGKEKQL